MMIGQKMNSRRRIRLRGVWLAAIALLLVFQSASAFESEEHRRIADAAFFLAVDWHGTKVSDGFNRTQEEIVCSMMAKEYRPYTQVCRNLSNVIQKNDVSVPITSRGLYGALAACVDQVESPASLVALLPENGNSGIQQVIEYWNTVRVLCANNPLSAMIMARANSAHFQGAAIASFLLYHQSAISHAGLGKLFESLVRNAAADHYLLDFHAGGHVVTDRTVLVDSMALGAHDRANRLGVPFLMNPGVKNSAKLSVRAIIEHICTSKGGAPYVQSALTSTLEQASNVKGVFAVSGEENELIVACERTIESIDRKAVVLLRGDGYLFLSRSLEQRLYLLAVQTASVLEVLQQKVSTEDSLTSGEGIFKEAKWAPNCNTGEGDCRASLGVGDYDLGSRKGVLDYEQGEAALPSPLGGPYSILLGGSVGFSTQIAESRFGMLSATLESWLPVNGPRNWWLVLAGVYSKEVEHDFEYDGFGWEARIAKGVAWLPGTVASALFRDVSYPLDTRAGDISTRSYGIRLDHGMSDMFGFFISLQDDTAKSSNVGKIFEGTRLSLGLSFKFPITRIPGATTQVREYLGL